MQHDLRLTVQLALAAARQASTPEVEAVKAADASADVGHLITWLRATPEPLRPEASRMAAEQVSRLMGGDVDFWALYLELDGEYPRPSDAPGADGELEYAGRARGARTSVPVAARAEEMRLAAPALERLAEHFELAVIVEKLAELGVPTSVSGLSAVQSAGGGTKGFYVPRERAVRNLCDGIELLAQDLAPLETGAAPTLVAEQPAQQPDTQAEAAPDVKAPPLPARMQPARTLPTSRKGRLKYIRDRLNRDGEVNINALSVELGLNNVGPISELMPSVGNARHVGNGVWKKAN